MAQNKELIELEKNSSHITDKLTKYNLFKSKKEYDVDIDSIFTIFLFLRTIEICFFICFILSLGFILRNLEDLNNFLFRYLSEGGFYRLFWVDGKLEYHY